MVSYAPTKADNTAETTEENAMPKFIIQELQDVASYRDGVEVEAKNLVAAKRAATRAQVFQNTVMVVSDCKGRRLAIKQGGRWHAA